MQGEIISQDEIKPAPSQGRFEIPKRLDPRYLTRHFRFCEVSPNTLGILSILFQVKYMQRLFHAVHLTIYLPTAAR